MVPSDSNATITDIYASIFNQVSGPVLLKEQPQCTTGTTESPRHLVLSPSTSMQFSSTTFVGFNQSQCKTFARHKRSSTLATLVNVSPSPFPGYDDGVHKIEKGCERAAFDAEDMILRMEFGIEVMEKVLESNKRLDEELEKVSEGIIALWMQIDLSHKLQALNLA